MGNSRVTANQNTIFLGTTTLDLKSEHRNLRRKFEKRGYRVLPNQPLPQIAEDVERTVKDYLKECNSAILLLGATHGVIPDNHSGTMRSVNQIQYEAVIQHQAPSIRKIIWMPLDLQNVDKWQQQVLDQVATDEKQFPDVYFPKTPRANLEDTIFDELKYPVLQKIEHRDESSPHQVYLICDEEDTENDGIRAVAQRLEQHELAIRFPLFKTDGATNPQRFQDHWDNLMHCDSVLILYGKGSEKWRLSLCSDLHKLRGKRNKALKCKAIYIGPEETQEKRKVAMLRELRVIENYQAFSPDHLAPFLEQILSNL